MKNTGWKWIATLALAGCATPGSAPKSDAARAPASVRGAFAGPDVRMTAASYHAIAAAAQASSGQGFICPDADRAGKPDPIGDGSPVDWRRSTLANFCRENVRVGMADFALESTETEVQTALRNGNFRIGPEVAPWQAAMYPDLRTLRANHDRKYFFVGDRGGFNGNRSIYEYLELLSKGDYTESRKEWPKDSGPAFARFEERLKREREQDADLKQAESKTRVLCSLYDLTNFVDCGRALKKIIEVMHPIENISLYWLVKEVLSDPSYVGAAISLAKTIQIKVDSRHPPAGDLFSDAVSTFRARGFAEEEATERAFKLLAIYGTNGANSPMFIEEFISEKNRGFYYALGVIGTGISVLDWRGFEAGRAYAYPKSVRTTCNNGKPYHFWIAAYLARISGRAVGDKAAGRQAAFIAELGYQMRGDNGGREPNRAFTVPTFDPGNNKIRIDLAWGAAGAAFGAASLGKDDGTIFDVDASLTKMLENTAVLKTMTLAEARKLWNGTGWCGFDRWTYIFKPKAGLKAVRVSR